MRGQLHTLKGQTVTPQLVRRDLRHCLPPELRDQVILGPTAGQSLTLFVSSCSHVTLQPPLSSLGNGDLRVRGHTSAQPLEATLGFLQVGPEAHPLVPATLKEPDVVAPTPLEHSPRQFHSALLSAEGRRKQLDA